MSGASKKLIAALRLQKREIDKEIKALSSSANDDKKLTEWKMLYDLKLEMIGRLKEMNVSWNKFVETPDYFEYAWTIQSGKVKRIKTSISKPARSETPLDEASMIKLAKEQRIKVVRRKNRRTWKRTSTLATATGGKAAALKTGGVL